MNNATNDTARVNFTGWRFYKDEMNANVGVSFTYPDGSTACRLLTDPAVVAWINAGGVPLP